jgi:YfiH family protein
MSMGEAELSFDFPGGGHGLFTTRAHGNLSSVGGDGAEHGAQARERLRERLGVRRLARGYQVHGTTVQRVTAGAEEGQVSAVAGTEREAEAQPATEADGQATAASGVGVVVLTADCLPVALGANGVVAVVHAGWRGLAAGVLEEGVAALRDLGGVRTGGSAGAQDGEIVAVIGPGAGPCCYEVGEEVHAAFGGAHRVGGSPTDPPTGGIDLKAIARERLLAAGASEVRDVDACTICDERFFSYRREGARAGRQGGVAWLD